MESVALEIVAMIFKRFVKFFGSLPGRSVAEQGILIATRVGFESLSLHPMFDHLAFPAIDLRRNWCQVFGIVEDTFDLFLQVRVQIIVFEVMFCKMVIEHLMFKNMIGICLGDQQP